MCLMRTDVTHPGFPWPHPLAPSVMEDLREMQAREEEGRLPQHCRVDSAVSWAWRMSRGWERGL
jgi:hypothetical protein